MKLHISIISAIVLSTLCARAETTKGTMNRDAFVKRSYTSNLALYILSRSTGRPFQPKTEPASKPEIEPAAFSPQPELNLNIPKTPPGLDPYILGLIKKYDPLVQHYSRLNSMDPNLTRAIIYVESAGDKKAVSSQGAMGLMQLMPDTATDMGVENAFDPAQNIFGGTRYLSRMIDQFGSLDLALWAYNAGPEAVKRKRLPSQTRHYIPNVIRVKRLLDNSQK